jgi:transposase
MDTSDATVMASVSCRKALPAVKRQYRSLELKRRMVEETLVPGASVARVARAHGVNANQLFDWRRQYRQGLLESGKGETSGLLAVRVTEAGAAASDVPIRRTPPGTIQVELAKGQLQLTGRVDAEALRVVMRELLA